MSEDDYKEMEDDLDDEPKPHCLGHRFHWAEIVFMLTLAAGIFFTIDASANITGLGENATFPMVMCIMYTAVAGIGTALVWNLVSLKRVAACADMMKKEVETLRAENERARNMQQQKREQDAQMKEQLANLEKAELLLKGSVQGLEDVQKQNEEMMKERVEMLEQRRELAGKLEKDMKELFGATIEQAREELTDRAELYFKHADRDNDGIEVGGEEWNQLEELMTMNGIVLNTAAAGEDGVMDAAEFSQWLDSTLRYHFDELSIAVQDCNKLREEITTLNMEKMARR